MQLFGTICALLLAALAVFLIYDIIRRFHAGSGNLWDKLLHAGQGSATMIWLKFVSLLGAVAFNIDSIAQSLGFSQVDTYINALTSNPKTVAVIMLGIAGVGALARLRTL